jgi:hypothetical protein
VKPCLKSVVREIRTLRSVGIGGRQLPPMTRCGGCYAPAYSPVPVDAGGLDLPGCGNRSVFPPGGGLGNGPAHEESPGDSGSDDGDQSQEAITGPDSSLESW